MEPVYKRVLLKLSGEALAGEKSFGFDNNVLTRIANSIKKCTDAGVEIGIVVGGGNFWRGRSSEKMDRVRADQIGMLATTMNAICVSDSLIQSGIDARVQTMLAMPQVTELFNRDKAVRHLEKGRVVIFGCGTGSPFFSTDTAAALKAVEIGADVVLKATMVDGVYDSDPKKNPDAKRFDKISNSELLKRGLEVMDATAASLCMNNRMPMLVFSIEDEENIFRVVCGENIATLVTE